MGRGTIRGGGIATLVSVDWFNHRRLLEPIGYVPSSGYEGVNAQGVAHSGFVTLSRYDSAKAGWVRCTARTTQSWGVTSPPRSWRGSSRAIPNAWPALPDEKGPPSPDGAAGVLRNEASPSCASNDSTSWRKASSPRQASLRKAARSSTGRASAS